MVELTKKQKKQILSEVGNGEWWKSSGQKSSEKRIKQLIKFGMSFEDSLEFVSGVASIIREEYGD